MTDTLAPDMLPEPRPIVVLSDSQLLFWKAEGASPLAELLRLHEWRAPTAAYLGACNGDAPEFYDLFVAAMQRFGITSCRQIPSNPTAEDLAFLATAHVILIAGGDPHRGWEAFRKADIPKLLRKRYEAGAAIIGVSAGAMLLGKRAWRGAAPTGDNLFGTFKLVPMVIGAHEPEDWPNLREAVRLSDPNTAGLGLPAGCGAAYFADHTLVPLRGPLVELWKDEEEKLSESLLFAGERGAVPTAETLPEPEIVDPRLN